MTGGIDMKELKKTDTLLFKFAAVFVVFTVITLTVSGLATFKTQTEDYREQCGQNIKNIGRYLADTMAANSEEVINYRSFFLDNLPSHRVNLYTPMQVMNIRHLCTKTAIMSCLKTKICRRLPQWRILSISMRL